MLCVQDGRNNSIHTYLCLQFTIIYVCTIVFTYLLTSVSRYYLKYILVYDMKPTNINFGVSIILVHNITKLDFSLQLYLSLGKCVASHLQNFYCGWKWKNRNRRQVAILLPVRYRLATHSGLAPSGRHVYACIYVLDRFCCVWARRYVLEKLPSLIHNDRAILYDIGRAIGDSLELV